MTGGRIWREEYLAIAARIKEWNPNTFVQYLREIRKRDEFGAFSFLKEKIELSDKDLSFFDRELEKLDKLGARVIYPGVTDYPLQLLQLERPPIFLTFIGQLNLRNYDSLSVVGSRKPTRNSVSWMELEFQQFLYQHPTLIVSGGARGIDQMAHLAAINANCPTIVVLPSGLGNPYPRELGELQKKVVSGGGAVISEYFSHAEMRPQNFSRRNRIIAGWSNRLLIVQAARRSGTMITAHYAGDLGKTILTLPGSPMESEYAGNNQLLVDGHGLVRDRYDLMCSPSSRVWGSIQKQDFQMQLAIDLNQS